MCRTKLQIVKIWTSRQRTKTPTNMADESAAPARAPGALLNNFILPRDTSDAAVLDTRQLAADLLAAFARSLVEEHHRCARTFVDLGVWLKSLQ
ncbi:hypothetical protein BD310DRAFT_941765 [Dichomitus squalens]|uniref:Uncharacterized protein n=1 Tax=Dichomitus squalens TaxID=114155 RepID=A0A4Q9PAM0_9APHY|nr:hypothetical protein BD310DRAFT_941765 [Dichomitus squalens]